MTRRVFLAAFVVGLLAAPFTLPDYQVTLLNYIGLGTLVALGLVLLTGIGGITSFGQAAFVGIGAYTTAVLTTRTGLSPWLTLPIGLVLSAASAYLIGVLTLRLSGHFLPLSTITWSLGLYFLSGNLEVLGGHNGITGLPPVRIGTYAVTTAQQFHFLIWTCVCIGLLLMRNLLDSRTGRALRYLRGRRRAAEAFGADTRRLRIFVFVFAATLAGASGWLYAHLNRFVSPTPFNLSASIEYLFMAVLGGSASIWGALFGAAGIVLIRDRLQDLLPMIVGTGGAVENIAFGVIMLLILQYARGGIVGWCRGLLKNRPFPTDQPRRDGLPRQQKPSPGTSLLSVDNVSHRFGGLVALDAVSFEIRAGEILAVIGPNGAGKSTLFNLITGMMPIKEGTLTFCGAKINGYAARLIATIGIARTFQHVLLKNDMSVLENAALGAHLRSRHGAFASMVRFDRHSEAAILSEALTQLDRVGLADRVGDMAGSLPLGQQRLVEIARAMTADPCLLLLDEPAAGLRYGEKRDLANLLTNMRAQGLSILVVEHDMDFVMNLVDRVVVLDFGRKIAEGHPDAVRADPVVREAYLGTVA